MPDLDAVPEYAILRRNLHQIRLTMWRTERAMRLGFGLAVGIVAVFAVAVPTSLYVADPAAWNIIAATGLLWSINTLLHQRHRMLMERWEMHEQALNQVEAQLRAMGNSAPEETS
jgi:hypothetical protein